MVSDIKSEFPNISQYIQISGETRDFAVDYESFLSSGQNSKPDVSVDASDLYIFICTGGKNWPESDLIYKRKIR